MIDVGTNSIKFHVAEPMPTGRGDAGRPGRGDALGEGSRTPAGSPRSRSNGRDRDRGDGGRGARRTTRGRSPRWGRPVCGRPQQRRWWSTPSTSGPGHGPGHPRRRGEPAGLPRRRRPASGLSDGSLVVFDTGGGSSQFTFGQGDRVDERFSVDVGAVRFTEQFGLDGAVRPTCSRGARGDRRRPVEPRRPAAPGRAGGDGRAVTNLTAVKHELRPTTPTSCRARHSTGRRSTGRSSCTDPGREGAAPIVGLQPKRADVILAGACIVRTVMEKLGQASLTVSDRGLRHGLLVDRFGLP